MVSPVLEEGATSVKAIFPPGTWYNLFDMTKFVISHDDQYVTLDAPLNEVNVHVYQSTILPMQQGGMLSKVARTTPFTLVVTFPFGTAQADAKGKVFVDDDERPQMKLVDGEASYVEFYATLHDKMVKVWSNVKMGKYSLEKGLIIEKIRFLGIHGVSQEFEIFVDEERVLDLSDVYVSPSRQEDKLGENKSKNLIIDVLGLALPLGKKFSMSLKMAPLSD
ncbi:hypothetical protein HPP92_003402 [Vanilla planifolia]|uniref:Glycosyl hydrolase family 31 C-terminal domain-containing protein n=1 Tax=Vanilla planifolia TaxID=51239 RepID=A0A835S2Y0_VANPL|nr:hypothetical protein HPP92_003402 [Vanilla planifolia]